MTERNIDVVTEIGIDRPRGEVADYASDPDNATTWYRRIKEVEWRSPRPLAVGTRVAFVADFLGRRLEYVYEVMEFRPHERLVMGTSDGPFVMETTYEWNDIATGTTMTLRNRGRPTGFSRMAAPALAAAMRRANLGDLKRLKLILERGPGG